MASGCVQASDKLIKDLGDIHMSWNYKTAVCSVELINGSLHDWHIKLQKVDPDSPLQVILRS